jgi:FkbM family methyltransferase
MYNKFNIFALRVLRRLGLVKYLNLSINVKKKDKLFTIPVVGGIGFQNIFDDEPWMDDVLTIMSKEVKSGSFIDVGVNIGQTLIKVKSNFDSRINYLGFEPNPNCLNYCTKLTAKNNWGAGVNILPVAISQEIGLIQLFKYSSGETDPSASIIQNFRPNQNVVEIQHIVSLRFNDIFRQFEETFFPRIVKIDVEGAELQVIESLREVVKKFNPIVLMEILPSYTIENSERINRQNTISKIFTDLGYQIYRICKLSSNHFSHLSALHQNQIEIHSNIEFSDYVFIHKDDLVREAFEIK